MDAASALADLLELSSEVEAAVALDADGAVLGSTLADDARTDRLAAVGRELYDVAAGWAGSSERELTRLEAALDTGSVFVVREAGRTLVATTTPAPTTGLVLYDLGTCLRALAPAKPKPRRRARRPKEAADA